MKPLTDEKACVLQTDHEIEDPDVSNQIIEKDNGDVSEIVELAASDLQDSQLKGKLSNLIGTYRGCKRSSQIRGRDGTFYRY